MVNGPNLGLKKFQDNDFPKIEEMIYENYNPLDEAILKENIIRERLGYHKVNEDINPDDFQLRMVNHKKSASSEETENDLHKTLEYPISDDNKTSPAMPPQPRPSTTPPTMADATFADCAQGKLNVVKKDTVERQKTNETVMSEDNEVSEGDSTENESLSDEHDNIELTKAAVKASLSAKAKSKKKKKKRATTGYSQLYSKFETVEKLLVTLNEQSVHLNDRVVKMEESINEKCVNNERAVSGMRKELERFKPEFTKIMCDRVDSKFIEHETDLKGYISQTITHKIELLNIDSVTEKCVSNETAISDIRKEMEMMKESVISAVTKSVSEKVTKSVCEKVDVKLTEQVTNKVYEKVEIKLAEKDMSSNEKFDVKLIENVTNKVCEIVDTKLDEHDKRVCNKVDVKLTEHVTSNDMKVCQKVDIKLAEYDKMVYAKVDEYDKMVCDKIDAKLSKHAEHVSQQCISAIYASRQYEEKGSRFVAFCAKIESDKINVQEFKNLVEQKYPHTKSAQHHMFACVCNSVLSAEDDGEIGAGEKLLNILHQNKISNTILMVCRWFGGIHLNSRRWDLIEKCATEALFRAATITNDHDDSPPPHKVSTFPVADQENIPKTVILCDSTGAQININRMFSKTSESTKIVAPTLHDAEIKVQQLGERYKNIIIQTGINDIKHMHTSQVKTSIESTLKTAKEYNPMSNIHIATILPEKNRPDTMDDVNQFIKAQSLNLGCKVIDTEREFRSNLELYRDEFHPNAKGTAKIVSLIKQSLGIGRTVNYGYRRYRSQNQSRPFQSGRGRWNRGPMRNTIPPPSQNTQQSSGGTVAVSKKREQLNTDSDSSQNNDIAPHKLPPYEPQPSHTVIGIPGNEPQPSHTVTGTPGNYATSVPQVQVGVPGPQFMTQATPHYIPIQMNGPRMPNVVNYRQVPQYNYYMAY